MLIIVTILINVGAIAAWSFVTGQNGFKEAAKMLRGEPAFIRESETQVTADPRAEEYYGDDSDLPPTSQRRTKRPNVLDPRFGRHPDEFYE